MRPFRDYMKITLRCLGIAICFIAIGCMPAEFSDAVPWQLQKERATDAKSQSIKGMPFLRVDDYLLDRLAAASDGPDEQAREQIPKVIANCHTLAVDTARIEISQLSRTALANIWQHCFRDEPMPDDLEAAICRRYREQLDDDYRIFSDRLSSSDSTDDMREWARQIRDRARPSVKDHRGAGALLEGLRTSASSDLRGADTLASESDLYEPGNYVAEDVKSAFDDPHARDMLNRYAPLIVQESPRQAKYPASCDMIGTVRLEGRAGRIKVVIQTDAPSVYAYTRKAVVRQHEHLQLVYCYWFPEHPPTKLGDPEAGSIDGATLRITLDSESRPAIVEAVQNCGCHYRCFAARHLDDAARMEFGSPGDRELSALTRPEGGAIEVVAADLFDLPSGTDETQCRPIVFSPAAFHVPVAISFDEGVLGDRNVLSRRRYELHAYEILENMPTDFGRASMFGPDGLVHNAGRLEGWLMAGTGMLSAGQPRQRGTQLICWDKHAFDDPHLLEEVLRLPRDF